MMPLWALLGSAAASVLYVNGVRADGLRDFAFEEVDVRIDEQGNVWITAPHYDVAVDAHARAATTTPAAPTAAASNTRYWLVTEDQASHGQTVEIWINEKLVKMLNSGQSGLQVDLTPFLHDGANTVVLYGTAKGSAGGAIRIRIGTGSLVNGKVSLSKTDIDHRSSATSENESNLSQKIYVQ